MVETLPIVVWTATSDGAIEFINHRWEEMTGRSAGTVVGERWETMVHPEDRERTAAAYRESLQSGKPFRLHARVRRNDGVYRWVRSQSEAWRDSSGNVARWFGVVLDMQEAHHAEDQFRALAESVPVIVWTADANGWIDWYSQRWYEFTGQSYEDSIGWGWQAAHHPDDFLEVMRRWPNALATGEPIEIEFRLRKHDGTFHWFLTQAEPFRDESGKVVRWYGTCVNIDGQKFTLERSKRIAETLHDIFLPHQLPQFSDLRLDAVYLPAEKDALIGGDWYDAFELPDGRLIFSIGDVAGHGLEASITVGRLRQAIFTLAWRETDPSAILKELDRLLAYQEPGRMVTAIVGCIDASHSTMKYAAAGHPPPLIARTQHAPAQPLPLGEPPLGIGWNLDPTTHTVAIPPDAVVAFYTDGMTEFSRDAMAVETKLAAAISLLVGDTSVARPARAIQERVFEGMLPTDDAALLLMQFSPVPANLDRTSEVQLEKVWRFHSSSAHTAQASRREIMSYLRSIAPGADNLFEVELIVGEIFANTVQHAPGLVEVRVEWLSERPVITVRDTGPGLEFFTGKLPDDVLSENGRGIFLVKTLAHEVTLKSRPGYGTELRAVLPLRRAIDRIGQAEGAQE
ncbi:MAG TPA: PAS domain-containing protein [Candidatus Tumulicola sp.]